MRLTAHIRLSFRNSVNRNFVYCGGWDASIRKVPRHIAQMEATPRWSVQSRWDRMA